MSDFDNAQSGQSNTSRVNQDEAVWGIIEPSTSADKVSYDPIFVAEQNHLSVLYKKLCNLQQTLVAKMEKNAHAAAADKSALCAEVAPNFADYSDAMDTYADYASVNRVIDTYNIAQSVDADKLNNIRLLLKEPYFAKIVLRFKQGEDPKELYIGCAGVSDEQCRRLVVDWRSPVAEVYYNQDNGATSYCANGRTIQVELLLRRQVDIKESRLNAYFDTTVAIQDELLLTSLLKRRSAHMQDITATIQKEQNAVIRHEDVPVLLVNGIAGSGKTSVLMQRIAYLFYQKRDELNSENVFLITPNPLFRRYVSRVLPNLGERNPQCLTWGELMQRLLPFGRANEKTDVLLDALERIDEACQNFTLEKYDFKEVRCAGENLISVAQINRIAGRFKKIPAGVHLVTLIREELITRLDARLAQAATTEKVLDEISSLDRNSQMQIFHETFNPHDEEEVCKHARQFVEYRFADAYRMICNDEWLRIDRIGMRLLGVENLTSLEWLYLKMILTGLGNPDARYVMIDEVQDYSEAQLMVLSRYFRRAHFLLLGDKNQALDERTATFDEVRNVFERMCGSVTTCLLMTSYRSTPQITELFAGLLDDGERMCVSSVQRDNMAPRFIECADKKERDCRLGHLIEKALDVDGLTAVIFPHRYIAEQWQHCNESGAVAVLDATVPLPERGVVLIPLKLAKGLEFDEVIIPDASERVFPDNPLSRRRLYTTISRATCRLTVLAEGKITPLLKRG